MVQDKILVPTRSTYWYPGDLLMTDEESTSIRIKKTTKVKLEKKGKFGESHNDIIERLLE